jgi:uncharacterized protein RhaS with RHS repeats
MGQTADVPGLPADHLAVRCTPAGGERVRRAYVYAEDGRVVVIMPPGESGGFTVEGARELARAVDRYATRADLHERAATSAASAPVLRAVPDSA